MLMRADSACCRAIAAAALSDFAAMLMMLISDVDADATARCHVERSVCTC